MGWKRLFQTQTLKILVHCCRLQNIVFCKTNWFKIFTLNSILAWLNTYYSCEAGFLGMGIHNKWALEKLNRICVSQDISPATQICCILNEFFNVLLISYNVIIVNERYFFCVLMVLSPISDLEENNCIPNQVCRKEGWVWKKHEGLHQEAADHLSRQSLFMLRVHW